MNTETQGLSQWDTKSLGTSSGPCQCEDFWTICPRASQPLPWTTETLQALSRMTNVEGEVSMYPIWINALQRYCPNFELVDTHDCAAPSFDGKEVKPDICLYAENSGRSQTTDICKVEIIHEFKLDHYDSPFCDEPPGFEYGGKPGWDTLSRITLYATAQMAAQFCTHIFMVLVFPGCARLLRWDRAGLVVSRAFSLKSRVIAEFYWKYCHASAEMRGRDVSVSPNLGSFDMEPVQIRQALGLPADCDLYRLSLGPGHDGYVFGTPSTYMSAYSPTGRSTRVFKAICVQNNQIVCIKDTWRITSSGYKAEHMIYEKLKAADVQYIPRLKEAGDILDHGTRTHLVAKEDWVTSKPWAFRIFRHYRLVFLDIGRDLWSFKSTQEYAYERIPGYSQRPTWGRYNTTHT
ncbi:hypothetical protein AX17_006019 [Amanita inopinata Kibby_2008]|nr:hypothetical protein AX17_006019 [Amanita inopinata Kibby_2008]